MAFWALTPACGLHAALAQVFGEAPLREAGGTLAATLPGLHEALTMARAHRCTVPSCSPGCPLPVPKPSWGAECQAVCQAPGGTGAPAYPEVLCCAQHLQIKEM